MAAYGFNILTFEILFKVPDMLSCANLVTLVKKTKRIGQLLAEIQRIKSEGDFEAARKLVEKYAVKIDPVLHAEILARYEKLHLAPYKGFVNPVYEAVTDKDGNIIDVKVSYNEGYAEQMLRYSKEFANLPYRNE